MDTSLTEGCGLGCIDQGTGHKSMLWSESEILCHHEDRVKEFKICLTFFPCSSDVFMNTHFYTFSHNRIKVTKLVSSLILFLLFIHINVNILLLLMLMVKLLLNVFHVSFIINHIVTWDENLSTIKGCLLFRYRLF